MTCVFLHSHQECQKMSSSFVDYAVRLPGYQYLALIYCLQQNVSFDNMTKIETDQQFPSYNKVYVFVTKFLCPQIDMIWVFFNIKDLKFKKRKKTFLYWYIIVLCLVTFQFVKFLGISLWNEKQLGTL